MIHILCLDSYTSTLPAFIHLETNLCGMEYYDEWTTIACLLTVPCNGEVAVSPVAQPPILVRIVFASYIYRIVVTEK